MKTNKRDETKTENSLAILAQIRKTHDTAQLSADEFAELTRAVLFYLRGGFDVPTVAKLVIEEIFASQPVAK